MNGVRSLFFVVCGIVGLNVVFDFLHPVFKSLDASPDSFHQFGDFLPAEQQKNSDEYDNQFPALGHPQ